MVRIEACGLSLLPMMPLLNESSSVFVPVCAAPAEFDTALMMLE